jgi:hypothetical protein
LLPVVSCLLVVGRSGSSGIDTAGSFATAAVNAASDSFPSTRSTMWVLVLVLLWPRSRATCCSGTPALTSQLA